MKPALKLEDTSSTKYLPEPTLENLYWPDVVVVCRRHARALGVHERQAKERKAQFSGQDVLGIRSAQSVKTRARPPR